MKYFLKHAAACLLMLTILFQTSLRESPAAAGPTETKSLDNELVTETYPSSASSGLDYVLGRPMTEDEINAQKDHEPRSFPEIPEVTSPVPVKTRNHQIKSVQNIPSSYDSRKMGYITSVKDQGQSGLCWAFASCACAEASLISKGLASADTIDLSEQHLAYFTRNPQPDPLGNTTGDIVERASDFNYLQLGGNCLDTFLALSNWRGYADEETAPFKYTPMYSVNLDPKLAYADAAHLRNAFEVPASATQDIKSLIMEYGAAGLIIRFENEYYNYNTAAYYCNVKKTNHMVTVIGWDDNYSAQNFKASCRPSKDGAWLVKNSWGRNWGNSGYFWISYQDFHVSKPDAVFYFYDVESVDNYDHNYFYDGCIGKYHLAFETDVRAAAVYKAGAGKTGVEALEAVGAFAYSDSGTMDYRLQVYKNLTDSQDPESGTAVYESPQTGTLTYNGFHTIPLKQSVPLVAGSTFSIVITFELGTNERITCYVDMSYEDSQRGLKYITHQQPGQTFLTAPGYSWTDPALRDESPYTMRLKAFTSDIEPVDLSDCTILLSDTAYDYDGTIKEPGITVRNGDVTLSPDIDYTISYSDNIHAGTASATVHGIGSYTGTSTAYFDIKKIDGTITAPDYVKTASVKIQRFDIEAEYDGDGTLAYSSDSKSVSVDAKGRVAVSKNFIGEANITITNNSPDYNQSICTIKITVNPAGSNITAVKKSSEGSFSIQWTSADHVTGYEIQYSTDKNFNNDVLYKRIKKASKTSWSVSGLQKGKTYYVRICTYKTISGKKYRSEWSPIKKIKKV